MDNVNQTRPALARQFAISKHEGQMYGDKPYEFHLQEVVDQLEEWGYREGRDDYADSVLSVGWLHDTLEDTDTIDKEISSKFGADILMAVGLVTDPEAPNREARKALLHYNFTNAHPHAKYTSWAALVKCSDRVCNHKNTILEGNQRMMKTYVREFPDFMSSFGIVGGKHAPEIWSKLFEQYTNMVRLIG